MIDKNREFYLPIEPTVTVKTTEYRVHYNRTCGLQCTLVVYVNYNYLYLFIIEVYAQRSVKVNNDPTNEN